MELNHVDLSVEDQFSSDPSESSDSVHGTESNGSFNSTALVCSDSSLSHCVGSGISIALFRNAFCKFDKKNYQ